MSYCYHHWKTDQQEICKKSLMHHIRALPGQSSVSSFSELTVSSDDNIVEAVPSNIRPKNAKNVLNDPH